MSFDIFDALNLEPMPWIKDGVCRDYGTPDDWFDSGGEDELASGGYSASTRRAVSICQTCPVQAECAEYAIESGEIYGVWGGLTPHARREIRRKRRKESA